MRLSGSSCRRPRSHCLRCENPMRTLATRVFTPRAQSPAGVEKNGDMGWGVVVVLTYREDLVSIPGPWSCSVAPVCY